MKQWPHYKRYTNLVSSNKRLLQQVFFAFSTLVLLWTYISHSFLRQVGPNPLVFQDVDPTYWLFMLLDIPALVDGYGGYIIDGLLVSSCLGSLLFPRQTITTWLFLISYFVYFVLYNLLTGHHYIHVGILFLSFPFVFANIQRFTAAFTFCRFLFCQMLVFAALWKIWRGNLTHLDQGSTLLLEQFKSAVFQKDSFRNNVVLFFIQHRVWAHLLWLATIGLEAVFIFGFITWKKDILLLISYLLFFVGGWFFFDVYIFENLLLLLTLAPVLRAIDRLRRKFLREKQQPITASNLLTGLPL